MSRLELGLVQAARRAQLFDDRVSQRVGEDRDPLPHALGFAYVDEAALEIEILATQPKRFQEA